MRAADIPCIVALGPLVFFTSLALVLLHAEPLLVVCGSTH